MTSRELTEPRHSLNAVCPYFTMFPLSFPLWALKHASPRAVVLDPFCGRGTSNYAARYLGLRSYGIDTSPVAVAIAKAKLADATRRLAASFKLHRRSTIHGLFPPNSSVTGVRCTAAFVITSLPTC